MWCSDRWISYSPFVESLLKLTTFENTIAEITMVDRTTDDTVTLYVKKEATSLFLFTR